MTDMSNGSREIVVVGFDLHVLLFPDYMSLPSLGHKKKEGKDSSSLLLARSRGFF